MPLPIRRLAETIRPNDRRRLLPKEGLHVYMAYLRDNARPGKTILKVRVNDDPEREYVLCSLRAGRMDQQKLDLYFKDHDSPVFLVVGPNPVVLLATCKSKQALPVLRRTDSFFYDDEEQDAERPSSSSAFFDDDGADTDAQPVPVARRRRFCDPYDNRFLRGFRLDHFGLDQDTMPADNINLSEEESDEEDRMLNDNIVAAIINSMLNSGVEEKMKKAYEVMKHLKKEPCWDETAQGSKKRRRNDDDDDELAEPTTKRSR